MALAKQLTGSSTMVTFPSTVIATDGHWAVGTQWHYAKSTVTMFNEGFHCDCKKKPRKQCNHITNVKRRMYGVFDEYYKEA